MKSNKPQRRRGARVEDGIRLEGVRVHNLQGIDVEIPRNRLVVITGVSGSGKSSLAFDTLYAEGRRRYVECLSTYLQQFLERLPRPQLDRLSRVLPAVAFERATPASQARSTVGSTTEIHDYLRLLFARVGRTFCLDCGRAVQRESPGEVADELIRGGGRGAVTFTIELPRGPRGWTDLCRELERDGFVRLWDGNGAVSLEEARPSGPRVEVVVDRLVFERRRRTRIAEAVETAYRFGHGRCSVRRIDDEPKRYSARLHCPDCDREYREPEPRLFSPNSPLGACPDCQGFGRSIQPDLERIIPDTELTLKERPIDPWNKPAYRRAYADLRRIGRRVGLSWDVPYRRLPEKHRKLVEQGGHGFYGIRGFFDWLETKKYKLHVRVFLSRYRAYRPCSACAGSRLRPEATAVRIEGREIAGLTSLPVLELDGWLRSVEWNGAEREIAGPILREIEQRVGLLIEVGLGYLSLDRPSRTLSGGEAQRIQIARAIGTSLVDTLYVLDEPSVGLHPRDVERLITVLHRLRDLGNTVVVVEHDARVIEQADWLIDLGPGAGAAGGRVLYQGKLPGLRRVRGSATADYLSGRRSITASERPPTEPSDGWIELLGASIHNLQEIDVRIPRRALTVVTGVSGSGKSSLVHDTLHGALSLALGGPRRETGPYRELRGFEGLSGVELVDQSPIGKSSRSNPVTYVKAFDGIRRRLAATPAAQARGLKPGYFSFNVPGGRCESCAGAGAVTVEMHFMPDLIVPCEECGGERFAPAALEIRDRGRNVADILRMTVREALEAYADERDVAGRLRVLDEIGLGYLRLGQPAPTLSGGEAQRLKLSARLAARDTGPGVFLLDEPTTGLHLRDVDVLVALLGRLVAAGHTVVVIEHHLDLIRVADRVIDLGPGAGPDGGRVVAQGSPTEVARSAGETGRYLARALFERTPGQPRNPASRASAISDGA